MIHFPFSRPVTWGQLVIVFFPSFPPCCNRPPVRPPVRRQRAAEQRRQQRHVFLRRNAAARQHRSDGGPTLGSRRIVPSWSCFPSPAFLGRPPGAIVLLLCCAFPAGAFPAVLLCPRRRKSPLELFLHLPAPARCLTKILQGNSTKIQPSFTILSLSRMYFPSLYFWLWS